MYRERQRTGSVSKKICYFPGYFFKSKATIMHYITVFASKVRCLNCSIYGYDLL